MPTDPGSKFFLPHGQRKRSQLDSPHLRPAQARPDRTTAVSPPATCLEFYLFMETKQLANSSTPHMCERVQPSNADKDITHNKTGWWDNEPFVPFFMQTNKYDLRPGAGGHVASYYQRLVRVISRRSISEVVRTCRTLLSLL